MGCLVGNFGFTIDSLLKKISLNIIQSPIKLYNGSSQSGYSSNTPMGGILIIFLRLLYFSSMLQLFFFPQQPLQHQQRRTNPSAIRGSPKYVRHPQQDSHAVPVQADPKIAKLNSNDPPTKHTKSEQAIK
jgi:hypothetical protein